MQSERSAGGWSGCFWNGAKGDQCTKCLQHFADLDYSDKDAKNICTSHGRGGYRGTEYYDNVKGHVEGYDFSGARLDSDESCYTDWFFNCVKAG